MCTRFTEQSARPAPSGSGVEPTGEFLHQIRRATSRAEFFILCRQFFDHDKPMPLEPFAITLKPADVMAGATR